MYDIPFGQFVDHRDYRIQHLLGFLLVIAGAQLANEVSGRLAVVAIAIASLQRLPDSFLCGLMMCHVLFFWMCKDNAFR